MGTEFPRDAVAAGGADQVLALPWKCRPDPYTLRHRSGVPVLAVAAPDDA